MEAPSISVLMTAYNAAAYLEAAARSVLAQTHRDLELVVVDDGSTDATADILARLAEEDPRVRVITQANAGIPAAANAGLAACRGELVARMDADDLSAPRRLEVQSAYLREHGLVCCGTWYDMIDEGGRRLKTVQGPTDNGAIQKMLLEGHGSICNPSSMFRRAALLDLGGYSPDMAQAEDVDAFLRLGEVGQLGNVPEALLSYRLHATSISEQKCEEQRSFGRLACERAWARRGVEGVFTADYIWRPGKDRVSRHAFAVDYGWWAFKSGESATAAHYGRRAIRLRPGQLNGYKLLWAATFRKPPSDALS